MKYWFGKSGGMQHLNVLNVKIISFFIINAQLLMRTFDVMELFLEPEKCQ